MHKSRRNQLNDFRPELQSHAQLISNNLQTIASQLSENTDTFRSTVAFPTPQFPGTQKASILEILLRTNLEPDLKEWVREGEKISAEQQKAAFHKLSDSDRNELWQQAPGAANSIARRQRWGADYTLAEKQNGVEHVVTGLQRELIEPPDDEDDEEGEDEEEEYEIADEEDEGEDAMEVEKRPQPKLENRSAPEAQTALPTAAQLPLITLHRYMTTGR